MPGQARFRGYQNRLNLVLVKPVFNKPFSPSGRATALYPRTLLKWFHSKGQIKLPSLLATH